jgi:pimeloyl-ACP methyl ester carboxylesterase
MSKDESGRAAAAVTRREILLGAAAIGVAACTPSGQAAVNQPNNSTGVIQMAKPTIVLVHGFWGGAAHWSKVIVQLSKMGYESVHAVENPLSSLADDAERTRKMIAQQKGPVVLVGHSYGGVVITEAGNQPNVVALVYIAAFAPDAGESLGDVSKDYPASGGASVAPDSDGYLWIDQKKYHESFCHDLAPDEALVMAVTQKAPLASTAGNKVKAPAWKAKPSWYQISSEDRMISPENEKRMSARMGAKKVITLPASHASLASRPLEVSALIDEAARATTTT